MNTQLDNTFNIKIDQEKIHSNSQVVPSDILDDAPVTPRCPSAGLSEQDEFQDIDYARRTLQFTLERSQQLVDLSLQNAADAASPRDIEVAANALNTCATLAEKLLDIYNKRAQIKQRTPDLGSGNTFVNNNKTIVLTSSELLKQLSLEDDNEDTIDVN